MATTATPCFLSKPAIANIVGYMSKDMPTAGYYNYTPMFVGVDGSDPAVKDIVPSTQDTILVAP